MDYEVPEKKLVLNARGSATDYLELRKVGNFLHVIGRAEKTGPDDVGVRMLWVLGKDERRQFIEFIEGLDLRPPVAIGPVLGDLSAFASTEDEKRALAFVLASQVVHKGERCMKSTVQDLDPEAPKVRRCLRWKYHRGPCADGVFVWRYE